MKKLYDDTFNVQTTSNLKSDDDTGGVGNTPPKNSSLDDDDIKNVYINTDEIANLLCIGDLSTNICFDWFNFRFNTDKKSDLIEIFKALKVNPDKFDESGSRNYSHRETYDENLHISYHGDTTADGYETSLLEISGQACRNFEKRGGNWYQLLYACLVVSGRCTRFDIALDDYKGILTLKELDDKLNKGYYSSRLRQSSFKRIITGKNGENGYTLNLGSGNIRICIYDKVSERKYSGYDTFLKKWIRYEFRFYGERADSLFKEILVCLSNQSDNVKLHDSNGVVLENVRTLNEYVPKVLNSIIEFKEYVDDKHNRIRAPICKKWQKLLGTAEKTPIKLQIDLEKTLMIKMLWLSRSCFKSIAQLYIMFYLLADSNKFFDYIITGIVNVLDDFTVEDVQIINNLLIDINESLYIKDFKKIKNYIKNKYKDVKAPIIHAKSKSKSLEAKVISAKNYVMLNNLFKNNIPF